MNERRLYDFGRFRLDGAERVLLRNGQPVALPPKDLETLLVLVENRGHIVEKEELMRRVWPDTFVEEGNLARRISNLRSVLGEDAEGRQFIDTVPKRGYRFVANVAEGNGRATVERQVATETARLVPAAAGQSWVSPQRKALAGGLLLAILVGVLILTIVGFGYWRAVPPVALHRVMVAILPVDNMSGSAEYDYVTDGITEEIISQLGQVNPEQLGVIARTSSMAYKGTRKRADEIGRELGAEYLLESSFRGSIEHMRITAQLIRAKDQTHVWAQNYDRDLRDIVSLEEEIAQAIAGEVELKLAPPRSIHSEASAPVGAEAYLLYLKGRQAWNTRSREGLRQSLTYFKQAAEKEPAFARAHAGVADALNIMLFYGFVSGKEVIREARQAAAEAVRLDDSLPDGHAALGYVNFVFLHDWPTADREFQRATALGPNYVPAHHWYALYLAAMGRREASFKEMQAAKELDPVSPIMNSANAYVHYFARDYDAAAAACSESLAHDPNFAVAHLVLGSVYEAQHRTAESLKEYQTVVALRGPQAGAFYRAQVARALALAGKPDEASKTLRELGDPQWNLAQVALVEAALGERDKALGLLEDAARRDDIALTWMKVDPVFDPLRNEPRFQALLTGLKFPE
jgi:TolB-like protein/DNA-binding winged helix-turn-helix (wHTH) protein/Tfp pilus assembly protein PilF